MMKSGTKNIGLRKTVLLLFLIGLAAISINYAVTQSLWNDLKAELIQSNTAILGSLIDSHPELEKKLIEAFTTEPDERELQKGLKAAARAGYQEDMPIALTPVLSRLYQQAARQNAFVLLLTLLAVLLLGGFFYRRIMRRFELIAEAAENIVEGDYSLRLPDAEEGAVAKLSHQFNRMSKILEGNIQKMKEERFFLKNIISDISHQLKTPLSSLRMFNELLLEEEMTKEEQLRFLQKSDQQLERMEWLIKSLLKMARIEAGAIEFQKELRPLLPTLQRLLEAFGERAASKSLQLELLSRSENICLSYDENWMSEAISNIIKNSIEHTAWGGTILIELSETPIMVRLTIHDNGEGIREEDMPHIFERFYKGRNNLEKSSTGIGLALAKAIIDSHGGLISVKSRLGQGTSFTITFHKGII